jgi:hypothetical protein
MTNRSTLRYIFIIIIVLILLSLCFIYVFSGKISKEKPYQTLTPDIYKKGTVVELYKNTPPNFPKEVVLENKTLDYSGTVAVPGSKVQIKVSYVSDKSMQNIVDLYNKSLPSVGWNIVEKTIYTKVSIIRATKGEQSILMSISPIKEGEVMVTFQYEK